MADIGTATVRVAPNMTGIQSKIAAGFKGSAGPATAALGGEVNKNSGPFQSALGKLGGIAKVGGIAIAGGIAAGAAGIAALTGKMLLQGAALEQQLGGSEAVFETYAKDVQKVAQDAYKNMGLSQNEFLQGANKMGSLYQGAGISVQKSMEMSTQSIQRATDVASIMGIDTTMALESVTAMAKGNFTMMDNLGVAMNDTALNAYALEKGIGKTTAQMSMAEKTGLATQLFMEKTAKFAGNYAKENETLSGSLNTTKKAFDDFMSGGGDIGNFVDSLIKTIEIAVPKIVEILPKIVNGLGKVLSGIVPVLAKALPVLIPALINAVQSLLNALITALPSVIDTLLKALPMFISAFVQLFLALLKALPQILQIISAALPQIIDAIVVGLTSPESLTAIILGAVELFTALITAIPIVINALVKAVPVIVKNIITTLTSREFISAMTNAGVQLMKATITGLVSMVAEVAKAVWKILGVIKETLGWENLKRVGADMVKGMWQGISDTTGWIMDKIKGFGSSVLNGIKSFFGIGSPSKVFAGIGVDLNRGLAQGIYASTGLVTKSIDNMSNEALSAVTDPMISPQVAFGTSGAYSPAGGSQSNTNQTVTIGTVALGDSSAVKEFFKQLNQDTINVGMGLTPIQGAQP